MRILWLNWRDTRNPEAGGAEIFTHEVARRLVKRNHTITLFASRFQGSSSVESIDGVQIIRKGGKYSVYKEAEKYIRQNEEYYDLIIDEINTRPFMTIKYVRKVPLVALVHQLAREFWFYETPFPINYIGFYFLEKKWLKQYKKVRTITVSESTKEDLRRMQFEDVHIVPQGLSVCPLDKIANKEGDPTLVFMSRLKRAKLPDHAIKAFLRYVK